MEYCVGELQEMLDSIDQHKFPIWQAHGYVQTVMYRAHIIIESLSTGVFERQLEMEPSRL